MPLSTEELFNRYADKTCTAEEKEKLMLLLQQHTEDEKIRHALEEWIIRKDANHTLPENTSRSILDAIFQADKPAAIVPVRRRTSRWIAAACVLLLAGVGIYLLNNRTNEAGHIATAVKKDIAPGGNRATLTLADGTVIELDNAANGSVAKQGSTTIIKLQNGQLAYQAAENATTSETQYNIITTPRGGQYQIALPDGSTVWLNAASSVRFPTVFSKKERKVEIRGEAYFQINGAAGAPFKVNAGITSIEVLGTDFNVMAYHDEGAIKTTLIEGKVKISQGGQSALLYPGQQAVTSDEETIAKIPVQTVDTEQAIAWKNGQFAFKDNNLPAIMRQLARWYNIEVEFSGTIPDIAISGNISRDYNISQVLKMLEFAAGIKYRIEDQKVILYDKNVK